MRSLFLAAALAAGLLLAAVPRVSACINDREVETHEREFKSDYLKHPGSPSAEPEQPPSPTVGAWALTTASGLGLGLLAGAAVLGLTRPARRP